MLVFYRYFDVEILFGMAEFNEPIVMKSQTIGGGGTEKFGLLMYFLL